MARAHFRSKVDGCVPHIQHVTSSFLLLSAYNGVIQRSTSLRYEPSSEPLLITAKQLFLNRELYRAVQLSVEEFSVVALKRCTDNMINGSLGPEP